MRKKIVLADQEDKARYIKLQQAIAQTLSCNSSRTYTFRAALVLATIDDLGMKVVEK